MQYYIIFILLFFSAILEQYIKVKQSHFIYILFTVVLILFAGTRYDFGRDYFVYKDAFYNLNFQNYSEYLFEPLFAGLCVLLRPLGFNFFIFFMTSVSIIYKTVYIKRKSSYSNFSLLIYYSLFIILYEMGQMRQALAMVLVLSAFNDCIERNKKGFYIKTFIAFGLHYSSLIILPCYWLVGLDISLKKMYFITIGILSFAFVDISQVLIDLSSLVSINHIALKVLDYSSKGMRIGINMSLLLRIFILFIFIWLIHKNDESNIAHKKLAILYFYGIFLYVIFNSAPEIAMRSAAFFKILEIFIHPILLSFFIKKNNRILIILFVSAYLIWTISNLFADHTDAFLPYKSFLL